MKIILCRHGETAWSQTGHHTGSTDVPLTKTGEKQAAKLSAPLAKYDIAKSFSSPRIRARDTARLAGFHPHLDPDLAEWDYGKYEGLTSEQIALENPDWNLFTDGAPGGESLSQVGARADRVLKKLRDEKGPILIFSHGHFSRVLAVRWLSLPPTNAGLFALSVASISILGHEHDRPVIRLWNSIAHLDI
jgi:probable phosphoglycerate mutase